MDIIESNIHGNNLIIKVMGCPEFLYRFLLGELFILKINLVLNFFYFIKKKKIKK